MRISRPEQADRDTDDRAIVGARLAARGATVAFPQLAQRLDDAAAARLELLRLMIHLYSSARGLGEPPLRLPGSRRRVPKAALQEARATLTLDGDRPVDFATLPVRHIGELYELLLNNNRSQRNASGSFYTPQPIVDYIVRQTVDSVFEQHPRPWQLQVLDPAMGTGHFLVAATRYLAQRLIALDGYPPERLPQVMRHVATHCIRGIDLDPLAVALARACLWLEVGCPEASPACLDPRLVCGDALADTTLLADERFDCILGNPPYGSRIEPAMRKRLVRLLPQMKHNGDTAVGFLERSSQLLAAGGRCGLIVPKPLTYSFAWRHMREFLSRRVEHIVDTCRAWPDVKLEQVILIFGPRTGATHYDAAWLNGRGFTRPARLSWRWAERFGTLPCALDAADRRRLDRLDLAEKTVGDLARTWRGLPWQRRLQPAGEVPVLGGRDLARWRTRSSSGFVSHEQLADAIEPFRPPKLLFQNIIAHIANPAPHIKLIGAYDPAGSVTLDTVNNLVPRAAGLPLEGLLALLHSRLVNWFVYSVIYNKAIRTMHFDQYFLNKVPLPEDYSDLLPRLAELARQAQRNQAEIVEIQREIDQAVEEAYGVPASVEA